MKKEFLLSSGDLFVLFRLTKISRIFGYPILVLILLIRLLKIGIIENNVLSFFYCLVIAVIFVEASCYFFKFALSKRNPPYKLIIDLKIKNISFELSYTKKVKSVKFKDIDHVLYKGSNLIFKLVNGEKFGWVVNLKEKNELDQIIQQSGIIIKYGNSLI